MNDANNGNTNSANNTNPAPENAANTGAIANNEYVKELFVILQENGKDTSGLSALINHVGDMENFVNRAESKLAEMRTQLADLKEVQNHPIKATLQKAINTLERQIGKMKTALAAIKAKIIKGCKALVTGFKEKGVSVLDNAITDFGVKKDLREWRADVAATIRGDDAAIAKIAAFTVQYHEMGKVAKNMARVLIGREPLDVRKEAGRLAAIVSAPYRAQKSVLTSLGNSLDKAIAAIERSEERQYERAMERKAERAAEPKRAARPPANRDFMGRFKENKERVEREKATRPAPERTKAANLEAAV